MKAFAAVLAVAFLLGGFVGGEILENGFSITGAVIGGVGTFAVLMGLGAFFTAREEKKPRSSLPPEIRGVFDRMSKFATQMQQPDTPDPTTQTKYVAKPFYKNSGRSERIEWFRNTTPWSGLDTRIVEQLCDKFGENPLFEAFVLLSMEQGLVAKYVLLNKKVSKEGVGVCPEISSLLSEFARDKATSFFAALKSRDKSGMQANYGPTCDALETAIILEPMNIVPYCQLTLLKNAIGKHQEARDIGMQGMLMVEKLKLEPLNKSKLPEISGAPKLIEMYLNMMADQVAEAVIELEKTNK